MHLLSLYRPDLAAGTTIFTLLCILNFLIDLFRDARATLTTEEQA